MQDFDLGGDTHHLLPAEGCHFAVVLALIELAVGEQLDHVIGPLELLLDHPAVLDEAALPDDLSCMAEEVLLVMRSTLMPQHCCTSTRYSHFPA